MSCRPFPATVLLSVFFSVLVMSMVAAAFAATPTISSITPSSGINTTSVSITNLAGTNFQSGATVMLTPVNVIPVHKGSIAHGGSVLLNGAQSVFISGNYAYVASWSSNSLEILNIADPTNPTHVGSIVTGGGALLNGAQSVYVSGNYAYVASQSSGALEIVDVSNPAAPTHKGSISDGGGAAPFLNTAETVFVAGNYAYVASSGSDALEIVDISNPAAPTHKGSIVNGGSTLLDGAFSVFVSGNYAYVASQNSDALEIVNVSNPAAPTHKGSIVHGGSVLLDAPDSVFVSGNYAYVTSVTSSSLEIVDTGTVTATGVTVAATKITGTFDLTSKIAGQYNVVVTNPDGNFGTLASGFTINPPAPTVTSIAPASGSTAGGTTVTITGTALTGATAVTFGGTGGTILTNTATQITATSPAYATGGTVDVTVTTAGGTSATSSNDQFTYTGAIPVISSISPKSGSVGGGTTVTITGTGFTSAATVKFGTTAGTGVTFVSATQITVTSPAGSAGTVDITVTTAGGTSAISSNDQFTYTPLPVNNGVSDSGDSFSVGGSTVATISNAVSGQVATFSFNQNSGMNGPVALIDVQVTFNQNLGTVEMTGIPVNNGGTPPGQTVVGYFQVEPMGVNQNNIENGALSFSVNGPYLEAHHLDPAQIMLMRNHDNVWTALSTTLLRHTGDTYFYQATTPGFSYFAVVIAAPLTAVNGTAIASSLPSPAPVIQVVTTEQAALPPVTRQVTQPAVPVTTATTAAPVAPVPAPGTGLPVMMIAGLIGIVFVIGGIALIRRWWIRRQNPTLFREYN